MKLSSLLSINAAALLLCAAAPVRAEGAAAKGADKAKAEAKAPDKTADKTADKGEAKADDAAPRSFAKKPAVGTKATCAVSGEVFTVKKNTQTATYKGRTYAFCCPDCKGDFEKEPAKFADPEGGKK